jgi:hypothetical protein
LEVESIADDPAIRSAIDEFAEDFEFRLHLTPQMIAAFPIFANHRYDRIVKQETHPPLLIEFLEDGPTAAPKPFEYRRTPGMSPLEFYAHFLFDDPPVSDRLCLLILNALEALQRKADEVRNNPDNYSDPYEYQRAVYEVDLPIVDFLRSPPPMWMRLPNIDLGSVDPKWRNKLDLTKIGLNMEQVTHYFPYRTEHRFDSPPPACADSKRRARGHRVHLNGAIAQFASWWRKGESLMLQNGDWLPLFTKVPSIPDLFSPVIKASDDCADDFEADAKG